MGTRGTFGFRQDGQDKLAYNHFDSYPDGLGYGVIDGLSKVGRANLAGKVRNIKLVTDEVPPTEEQIQELASFSDTRVGKQTNREWYCLLRECQGDVEKTIAAGYMESSPNFIKDSLFCEYGYIVNLDEDVLELYQGFQKSYHSKGRYASTESERAASGNDYYPSALIGTIPLQLIFTDPKAAKEALRKAYESEEDEDD